MVIDTGPVTFTVAVASAIPGAEARIVVLPGLTAVTGIFSEVWLLPSQNAVTFAFTVATLGLLELSVTVSPVGGGGAGPENPRVKFPLVFGLRVKVCGEKVKVAVTWIDAVLVA